MSPKPGQEGPTRLDMLKVWLLDPRSRINLRRRLAEVRITRRSLLAAGMAVWLLYAALVWQFGGRRLEGCTSLACRALLGGLPFGHGGAPPAEAAGSAGPTPTSGRVALTPGAAPPSSAATTTTTTTLAAGVALLPSTTGAPPPTAGVPTSSTVPGSTSPSSTTATTTAGTSTTLPQPRCKPKKHRECKPRKHPPKKASWWLRWPMEVLGRAW